MFDNVRDFFYKRRRGLATAVGFAGAFYLAAQYVMERLEEIREQVVEEKTAREKYFALPFCFLLFKYTLVCDGDSNRISKIAPIPS